MCVLIAACLVIFIMADMEEVYICISAQIFLHNQMQEIELFPCKWPLVDKSHPIGPRIVPTSV